MTTQLYTVTLTDLGTYEVTVAANDPKHAGDIAKTILFEHPSDLSEGLTCVKREAEAQAQLATDQPIRQFDVMATYSMEFFIRVPAMSSEDAELQARRIYAEESIPFEYATGEDRVTWRYATEVVS